jgi:hypothetical protein
LSLFVATNALVLHILAKFGDFVAVLAEEVESQLVGLVLPVAFWRQ